MVECNNGADGHDLIDNKALLARRQFEGLESTTQKIEQRGLPEYCKPENKDPLLVKHGGSAGL
jgi:hypothetical protein